MAKVERLTITLSDEIAAAVKSAVDVGDYASTSEIVGDALRDWSHRRALQHEELAALKADIEVGLADMAAGRVGDWNRGRVIQRGRELLARRAGSK